MKTRLAWLWLVPPVLAADPVVPWHHPLYLANHGYWPHRVSVRVVNDGTNAVAGEPVWLSLPALAGQPAESVRACDAAGTELLFDVITAAGLPRRSGPLAADDQFVLPVLCAPRSATTLFVYAGNAAAWPVPDFLRAGLCNGGFEAGETHPAEWTRAGADAQHRLSWERSGGRHRSRCVRAEVDAAAPPAWVQWRQTGLPITPGRAYEFTAWVRAENVTGRVGWFVHVDGEKPQLVNQVLSTRGGTHDWELVRVRFTAPPTSRAATIGTVLYGTGRAWYDDAGLKSVGDGPAMRATVGALETLDLAPAAAGPPQFSAQWPVCARVRVVNVSDRAIGPALVAADLRPTLGRWLKIPPDAAVRVTDAASDRPVPSAVRVSHDLLFPVTLPPCSIREFQVYLDPARKTDRARLLAGYEQLLNGPANLAPNGSFEDGPDAPPGWSFGGDTKPFAAGLTNDARFGRRALRFTVPTNAPANWTGWRSGEIPVRPGASYFLSGFLKSRGVDGAATLHAHWHTRSGAMASNAAFVGTQPSVREDSDWTQSSALVQAPADAASIQLHLTMNAHGTLEHDGLLLCEVLRGEAVRLETAETASATGGLRVAAVNPLIKVFPDDPPAPAVTSLTLECARNEYEPLQLVVHGARALGNLDVTVSPLRNTQGATLPPVKVERVGFVPVDHPSGYFQSKAEEWQRKLPHGRGSTDGWSGEWPDPLLPATPCAVAAHRNQPYWLTIRAPHEAAPGEYRGQVTVRTDGEPPLAMPIAVRVLPFALPERTRLRAIFDFRFGPGGKFGSGDDTDAARRHWLRFLAAHRLGIDTIEPAPVFTYTNGRVQMDASAFDATARFCFEELGMNVAYTPWFFYMFGWAYPPKKLFALEPFTPEWTGAFRQAYRLFSDHLKARGWHDRFVYYISDEPHFHHEFVVEQMKKLCALIHEVDPKIPIYSSTWRHCAAWDKSLDLWGVGQYGCFPVEQMERLRRAGRQFWFTCDGQMATDTPYLATERLLPYYCFRYGATGFEFWGVAWWTYDPWRTGWHTFIRQSDDGKRHYWIRYPNGDGFLTYPGPPLGVEGPLTTIRLEQVREGLEDYEALTLLAEAVEKAKRTGRSVAAAEAALAMARELVVIPNAGGLRSSEILPDPDRLLEIRRAVNAALAELER